MAAGAGSTGDGGEEQGAVSDGIGDAYIADTLARHGEGLGVGIAHDGVAVDAWDKGHDGVIVHELAVRLVGDYIDRVAKLRAPALKERSKLTQRLLTVNDTGWVIRGVDDDGLSVRRERSVERFNVYLEALGIGRDLDKLAAVAGDEHLIFREIRRDGDEFRPLHRERAYHRDERGSRAAGEEDILGSYAHAAARTEVIGDGAARFHRTGGGSVAMQGEAVAFQKLADDIRDGRRRGHGGIAYRIVIHVLFADDRRLTDAVFKKLAYLGLLCSKLNEAFGDHLFFPFPSLA